MKDSPPMQLIKPVYLYYDGANGTVGSRDRGGESLFLLL